MRFSIVGLGLGSLLLASALSPAAVPNHRRRALAARAPSVVVERYHTPVRGLRRKRCAAGSGGGKGRPHGSDDDDEDDEDDDEDDDDSEEDADPTETSPDDEDDGDDSEPGTGGSGSKPHRGGNDDDDEDDSSDDSEPTGESTDVIATWYGGPGDGPQEIANPACLNGGWDPSPDTARGIAFPEGSSVCGCGDYLEVSVNGKTEIGRCVDHCEGCKKDQIDLMYALFTALEDPDVGEMSCSVAKTSAPSDYSEDFYGPESI